jgi:hypothetical protein
LQLGEGGGSCTYDGQLAREAIESVHYLELSLQKLDINSFIVFRYSTKSASKACVFKDTAC